MGKGLLGNLKDVNEEIDERKNLSTGRMRVELFDDEYETDTIYDMNVVIEQKISGKHRIVENDANATVAPKNNK